MINPNLALRIVSGSSDSEGSGGRASCSDSLTILPQRKGSGARDEYGGGTGLLPDILTIVPQSDSGRQPSKSTSSKSRPQLMTAAGKVTPGASRVVKLVLLPKEEEAAGGPSLEDSEEESDPESEEGGMVIDVREEEPPAMDPLSLCTVTMEEEEPERSQSPPDGSAASPPPLLRPSLPPTTSALEGGNDSLGSPRQDSSLGSVRKTLPLSKVDEEKYRRRKYVCPFCEKRFGWSTDLKRHVILHTGERPFKCKWCPITFTRKFLLQNHMKKIHSSLCKWSDLWE